MKAKEVKLRRCYAESIDLKSRDFVIMILLDALFLIEVCLRGCEPNLVTDDDRIFGKPWTVNQKWCDLWLVENQILIFILNDLFNLAKTATRSDHYEGLSFSRITNWFLESVAAFVPLENSLFEINISEVHHFLDWLILRIHLSRFRSQTLFEDRTEFRAQSVSSSSPMGLQEPSQTEFEARQIPSATELHQAVVKFIKSGSTKNLLDIAFNKGILEIAFLTVYDNTERFYRNIIVFEGMRDFTPHYFGDYVITMSYLVNTAKDAELVIQKIIGLGNAERLSTVFRNLVKDCGLTTNFQYSGLVEDLRIYCDYPWHKWKATLKQKYFNTPWASMSIIAAVILLVLTFIQTACSIIAL